MLVLISCGRNATARPGLKPIGIAREALEVHFRRVAEENPDRLPKIQPERNAPAGPDQHHHV